MRRIDDDVVGEVIEAAQRMEHLIGEWSGEIRTWSASRMNTIGWSGLVSQPSQLATTGRNALEMEPGR